MELGATLSYLYPNLTNGEDYFVLNKGEGPYIASWNADMSQPTEAELQTAWEQLQANPPVEPLSPIDELRLENKLLKQQLEQTNADMAAFMDYVLGGM